MEILQDDNGKEGRFYFRDKEQDLAELVYVWSGPDKMIIDHTEVDKSLEGKGVGKALVAEIVKFARARKVKILPLCPYARHVLKSTPDYADVLFI